MKNIERIYIAPFWYDIVYDQQLSAAAGVLGACNSDILKILMQADNPEPVMMETLFHEALHAAWTQTGLDKAYSSEQEEEVIYSLSPRMTAILKDNPAFTRRLTKVDA